CATVQVDQHELPALDQAQLLNPRHAGAEQPMAVGAVAVGHDLGNVVAEIRGFDEKFVKHNRTDVKKFYGAHSAFRGIFGMIVGDTCRAASFSFEQAHLADRLILRTVYDHALRTRGVAGTLERWANRFKNQTVHRSVPAVEIKTGPLSAVWQEFSH